MKSTRRLWTVALVATLFLTQSFAVGSQALAAEGGSLVKLDGSKFKEQDMGDAIVVFFATWSPKCRDIVPRVNKISEEWGGSAQIFLVSFHEQREAVVDFLDKQKDPGLAAAVKVLLDVDGSFSKENSITYLPGMLVRRSGQVKSPYTGKLPTDPAPALKQAFRPSGSDR